MKMYTMVSYTPKTAATVETEKTAWAKEDKGKYYIRLDNANKLYDPLGIVKPTGANREGRQVSFKEVQKPVFDLYLKYLQTKEKSLLTSARKGVIK